MCHSAIKGLNACIRAVVHTTGSAGLSSKASSHEKHPLEQNKWLGIFSQHCPQRVNCQQSVVYMSVMLSYFSHDLIRLVLPLAMGLKQSLHIVPRKQKHTYIQRTLHRQKHTTHRPAVYSAPTIEQRIMRKISVSG